MTMDPSELMVLEHRIIKAALQGLDAIVAECRSSGLLAVDIAKDCVDFFRVFADELHHAKEEQIIFPELERQAFGHSRSMVADLTSEHEAMRIHVRAMREACDMPERTQQAAVFSAHATSYAAKLRTHIRREDDFLFVVMNVVLSPSALEQLRQQCELCDEQRQSLRLRGLELAHRIGARTGVSIPEWPPVPAPLSPVRSEPVARQRPARIAIVGAGPAGFYAAAALLNQSEVDLEVDLIERLPTPYGLVRAGVAPDHENIKGVTRIFDRCSLRPGFRFFGNVEFGKDVLLDDLHRCYDGIVFAIGSELDRRLGIPGEGNPGTTPASVFVGWYNAHPDFKESSFDFDAQRVAVIGNGNVALDIARMLIRDPRELSTTDVAEHALTSLARSQIRDVFVLGRRSALDATCTPHELRELCRLSGVDVVVESRELESHLAPPSPDGNGRKTPQELNLEELRRYADLPVKAARRVHFRFHVIAEEFVLNEAGRVCAIVLQNHSAEDSAETGPTREVLPVDWVFTAIGYRTRALPGLPLDEARGVIANVQGRIQEPGSTQPRPGEYCVGWARTGPKGVIGSHKIASGEVTTLLLEDLRTGALSLTQERSGGAGLVELLEARGVPFVTFDDWRRIAELERERGALRGAPRSKLADIDEMLQVAVSEPPPAG